VGFREEAIDRGVSSKGGKPNKEGNYGDKTTKKLWGKKKLQKMVLKKMQYERKKKRRWGKKNEGNGVDQCPLKGNCTL